MNHRHVGPQQPKLQDRSWKYGCVCVCVCVHMGVCVAVFCLCGVFPWPGALLVSHWSYEGEGVYHFVSLTPTVPRRGRDVHMGVGWAGCCTTGGSTGLWSGPSPASRVVNVFRVQGGGSGTSCVFGEREGGPPTWPWGSMVFYTRPPLQGWEKWGRERGWACCGYGISSPRPGGGLLTV